MLKGTFFQEIVYVDESDWVPFCIDDKKRSDFFLVQDAKGFSGDAVWIHRVRVVGHELRSGQWLSQALKVSSHITVCDDPDQLSTGVDYPATSESARID